jgi:hypothetical protein
VDGEGRVNGAAEDPRDAGSNPARQIFFLVAAGLPATNESSPRYHSYILIALKAFRYKSLAIDAGFSS